MKKRILSVLLTLVMLIGLVTVMSVSASATETTEAKWAFGTAETAPDEAAYTNLGTLAEAFAAANGNADATNTVTYVKLNKDVSMTHTSSATALTLNEGKAMVLDLGGYTFSCTSSKNSTNMGIQVIANSSMTVKNGTIDVSSSNSTALSTKGATGIKNEGNLNAVDCTITVSAVKNATGIQNEGNLNAVDCTITVRSTDNTSTNCFAVGIFCKSGKAAITNCKITATSVQDKAYGIRTTSPDLTITDSNITATGGNIGYAFYLEDSSERKLTVVGTVTATGSTGAFDYKPTTNEVTVTAGESAPGKLVTSPTADTYKSKYVKIESLKSYTVTTFDTNGETRGGSYSIDKTTAIAGETVTITPTPNSGYEVGTIKVYKTGDENTTVTVNDNQFTMPDYAVTVSVTFIHIHTHCVCGAQHVSVGDHTELSSTKFTAVTTQEELQSAATEGGCVYLANDIALTSTLAVAEGKTLILCLNGKKLSCAATVIKVEAGATFHLTDCGTDVREGHINAATKLWTAGTGSSPDDVEYNLTGGVITGGQGMTTADWGTKHAGAIRNSGTVYIYSGNVAGNQAIDRYSGQGGAIFNATGSSLYVYGGSIVGNYASETIIFNYEENNVVFTGNAVFAYNTSDKQYSIISSRYGNGSLEISGNASFSHNHGGEVVYAKYESLVIKDDASFTDNQVNNVIYYHYDYELEAGKDFRMDGSILMEGNTKPDDGSPATDLFVDFTSYPDALIILTAPLTRSYSVELPFNMMGGVLVKGDGTNVAKLTAADAAKFTDVDGRPMTAANDVVYVGLVIFDQPDENNNYTVNATDNPTYQWYVIGEGNYNVTDEMVTGSENNYDSATGKWSAVVYGMAYYFEMDLHAGDVITLVFDDAVEGEVVILDYTTYTTHVLTVGEGNTYTFTAPNDGYFRLAVDNGGSAEPAMLTASASDTTYPAVTASVYGRILTAVAGQTDATLNTENLESGRYLCEVTWFAEDEYSNPYILMTDTVTLQYYDVIFDYGTLGSKTVSILEDKMITAETPEFDGHIFMGWFTDATYQTAFDFDTPITATTTVYAKFGDYEGDKEALQGAIDALEDDVKELNKLIEADGTIDQINDKITEIQNKINSLEETYATDAEVADAIAKAKEDLKTAYTEAINKAVADLETKIAAQIDPTELAAEIKNVTDLIDALDDTYATDTELANAIAKAESELATAVSALEDKIAAEIGKLQNQINANDTDIDGINASITTINGLIDALESADITLGGQFTDAITKAENELKAVQDELKKLIGDVQSDLDSAKAELDKAIADLDAAMKQGDADLSAEIANLNTALANAKAALEKADSDNKSELITKIDEADAALQAAIDALASELDSVKDALEAKDAELEKKVAKTKAELLTVIIIVCIISGTALYIIYKKSI